MVAAIDGTEYYNTERPSELQGRMEPTVQTVHRQKENVTVTEYYSEALQLAMLGYKLGSS